MTCVSRFRYNAKLKLNVDLKDNYVIDVKTFKNAKGKKKKHNTNYGRQLHFFPVGDYLYNPTRRIYLHQVICGACVFNPRPKLFTVVDHKNGNCSDNRPSNLDHVNQHINNNNKHWYKDKHGLPPGLCYRNKRFPSGKWHSFYEFRKCCCRLKSWNTGQRQEAIDWAIDYYSRYKDALKNVYVTAPDPDNEPDDWRTHFRKYLIPTDKWKWNLHKEDVLALRRFPISPVTYLKLTGSKIVYK